MKKILILTAGYGEGHNSAARGIRDGLARVAPDAQVELHDVFAESYGRLNEVVRKAYLGVVNKWPRSWGLVYRWLDEKKDFQGSFAAFSPLKKQLRRIVEGFQPDVVVSVFPAYPYLLEELFPQRTFRTVVVVTDSITVNAIWYRCVAGYFLVPNEPSARVVRAGGVPDEKIRTFGFPVNPLFADEIAWRESPSSHTRPRVIYMINAARRRAPELVHRLLALEIDLTVTVGRDENLRRAVERAAKKRPITILGWTDQLPQLLKASHLLIGKAGGATVQETIAAGCPMIINHVVSGQEEGNAQLLISGHCGAMADSPAEAAALVEGAFADNARQWREWAGNIARMSRPRASLDVAEFLLSI